MDRENIKELVAESLIANWNRNFDELEDLFNFQLNEFTEFNTLLLEINKCLSLEFHRAAITLTNHLAERLLKLALISKEVGIGAIPIEKLNDSFRGPNEKYGSISFGNSIQLCSKEYLITKEEEKYLFETIRGSF